MTEQEIIQNAKKYVCPENSSFLNLEKELVMTHFIAGAHSRNKEVEELKKKLEDITILKDFFASSLDIYDKDNRQLQDELKIYRNQWISVKERLPKKKDGKIRSDVVLATLGQSWTIAEYHFGDKRWINLLGERETIEPEYWQEVNLPEEVLEKGE